MLASQYFFNTLRRTLPLHPLCSSLQIPHHGTVVLHRLRVRCHLLIADERTDERTEDAGG